MRGLFIAPLFGAATRCFMSSLFHAKSVQTHLEHFIDETLDLDLVSLFQELQKAHQELKMAIDKAETWSQKKEEVQNILGLVPKISSTIWSTFPMVFPFFRSGGDRRSKTCQNMFSNNANITAIDFKSIQL